MRTLRALFSALALVSFASSFVAGCGGGVADDPGASDDLTGAKKRRCTSNAQCHAPQLCVRGTCKTPPPPPPGPGANPPPAACDQRHAGVTAIQVLVRIDQYRGLISGRNGSHEIAYGTVVATPWVFDAALVDTSNVQLAMNVASSIDPSGLPHEIRLAPGETVEVEGEYIPAATANAHDAKGPAAVIHYTHSPCGYVVASGKKYQ